MSSMIQMLRPWVPTTRSLSLGWTRMSSTRTVGSPFWKRCPFLATVQGDEEAELGSQVEEVRVPGVLGDDLRAAHREVVGDGGEGLPEVPGHVDIGVPVFVPVIVQRDVAGTGGEVGGFHPGDPEVARRCSGRCCRSRR